MIKLRLFLVLMAAGMVALLIQLARLHAGQTPESLLERAREELTAEEPDYDGAFLRIDRGLAQCRTPETEELKKELARTRILLHRSRWEHGRENPDALQDESDLDQVLILGTKYLERFDLEDKEILRIAALSGVDAEKPEKALAFLKQLEKVGEAEASDRLLRAEAHALSSEKTLSSIPSLLTTELPANEAMEIYAVVREACARPPDHPQRIAALERLEKELPRKIVMRAMRQISRASKDLGLATTYYLLVLEEVPSGQAIVGLQDILVDARSHQKAIDLAVLALGRPDLTDIELVVHSTIRTLLRADRHREARILMTKLVGTEERPGSVDLDFETLDTKRLYAWCPLFLELESWDQLRESTNMILGRAGTSTEVDDRLEEARFYSGLSCANLSPNKNSGLASEAFWKLSQVEARGRELYPGMFLELNEAMARCVSRPNPGEEARMRRGFVMAATDAAPLEFQSDRLRRVAGRAYRMMGQILMREVNPLEAESAFTHALRLLPEERATVERAWEEAGEAAIEKRGRKVRGISRSPWTKNDQGLYPEMGPFEACLRAESGLKSGRYVLDVATLLQPVLVEYPGLPRALQALARTELLEFVENEARHPWERVYACERLIKIGPSWEVAPRLKRVSYDMQEVEPRVALQCLLWTWY